MKLKFDPYQFNKTVSSNIPIHWKNISWANGFVYIYIVIGVGARHDPVGKEGLAHFLEHLPFDGCLKWPTFGDIEEVNRALFSRSLNAYTNFERTVFTCKVDKAKQHEVIRFLSYFIFSPIIDPKEVERERKVITQEIWRIYGNKRREDLEKHEQKLAFGDHPFGRTERAFGWHDTVAEITRDDIHGFHSAHYCSGNTSILVAGDVNKSELQHFDLLTEFVPVGKRVRRAKKITQWPNPKQKEHIVSASAYFGLQGPSIPQKANVNVFRAMPIPENEEVLFIARDLVGQILFTQIRGKLGAMYSPKVSGNIFTDHSFANISLEVAPNVVDEVRAIITKTIAEIASGSKKHTRLFEETKAVYLQKKLFCDLSVDDIVGDVAYELAVSGEIKSMEEDYSDAEKVTYRDIVQMFRDEFNPDQLFWTIMTP